MKWYLSQVGGFYSEGCKNFSTIDTMRGWGNRQHFLPYALRIETLIESENFWLCHEHHVSFVLIHLVYEGYNYT